jgi:hypothetical protein
VSDQFCQEFENGVFLLLFSKFLGAFAKLQKATGSFFMSVCLSACVEQLGSHWTYFDET